MNKNTKKEIAIVCKALLFKLQGLVGIQGSGRLMLLTIRVLKVLKAAMVFALLKIRIKITI